MPRLPKDQTGLALYTDQLWHSYDQFYNYWIEKWRRTIDYVRAEHWQTLLEKDEATLPSWREFPVTNFTMAFYNDYLVQWMQSRVRFSAVPDSADPKEVSSAELADHVLAYLWEHLDIEGSHKPDLGAWLFATGNADLRVFYNTDTGERAPLAEMVNGQMVNVNPETMQQDPTMQQPHMMPVGDIQLETLSPQFVRWSSRRSEGVMVGYVLTYDEAVDRFDEDVAKSLSYGALKGAGVSLDPVTLSGITLSSRQEDVALVMEHYLPKSSRAPGGTWWVTSGRTLIKPPEQLVGGRIPIIHFRWVPFPGHPYFGLSPLYDVTKVNKIYDKMEQRKLEWAKGVVPKKLLVIGGGVQKGDLTDEPGQEIPVQPAVDSPVKYTEMPTPPAFFDRVQDEAKQNMAVIAGHQFQRPTEPPQGAALRAFRQPTDQQNAGQQIAMALMSGRSSWRELGAVLLSFVGEFYDEPKVATIVGPDRSYQWREFVGLDMQNLRAHVRVDELPLYTWNRQSMRDAVIGLLSTDVGAVVFAGRDGQLDRDKIDAAMEAVGLDVPLVTQDVDVLEARNEIHMIENLPEDAEGLPAQPWQNHEVHVQEKSKIVKSLSFRGWPEHRQQAMISNIQQHEQAVAEAQKAASESMLTQEKQLRDIRAKAETAQDVSTALGEELVALLMKVMQQGAGIKETSTKEKKS